MARHDHATGAALGLRRGLSALVVALAALALAGVAWLWPRGPAPDLGPAQSFVDATITSVTTANCPSIEADALVECQIVSSRLSSGPARGGEAPFLVPATDFRAPNLEPGDRVVLFDAGIPGDYRYGFADFQRSGPMWWLLAIFVVAVVLVGRWQGVRALVGLVASIGILVTFVLPALLRGSNATAVAVVGVVVIAFLALYLAHGVSATTTVALLGTLVSLVVITGLAAVFVSLTELTGLVGDEAQTLRITAVDINLQGLLLAGIVIGALGVLDDVTVTQVSAVAELRSLDPTLGWRPLYVRASRIGRDHVASTINTLVLAYAGASLPLLLLFVQGGQPIGRVMTSEVVAMEVVRALVGSIGLVLAVPVTTALAALVLTRTASVPTTEAAALPDNDDEPGPQPDRWTTFAPEEKPFS